MKFIPLRKFLAALLCFVLAVSTVFTVAVQAANPVQAVLLYAYNFRTGPGTSYAYVSSQVPKLPAGQTLSVLATVTGENVSGYGNQWYQISTTVSGTVKTGYIIKSNDVQVVTTPPTTPLTFDQQLALFPASYRTAITSLHNAHPNWSFTALNTGYDWNNVLDNEDGKNAVASSSPISQRSLSAASYDPTNDSFKLMDTNFYYASRQTIGYYMDPRNFLDDSNIFMFENLGYRSDQTVAGVEAVLKGTFMSSSQASKITYYDTSHTTQTINKTYAQVILEAAQASGCSAYFLAARIRQEIGTVVTGSVSGEYGHDGKSPDGVDYTGYYNFFNIGAYDSSSGMNIANGLKYAKTTNATYLLPWNTPEKAIKGGAVYIANGYINARQDTLYLQKFNVDPPAGSFCLHQYMTSVHAPSSESLTTSKSYVSMGIVNNAFDFKIPVFNNMPASPMQLTIETRSANNYITALSLSSGTISPTFIYSTNGTYAASVGTPIDSVTITGRKASTKSSVSVGSSVKVAGSAGVNNFSFPVSLNFGDNTIPITVTSESGVANTYNLKINRDQSGQNCTVTFNSQGGTTVASKTATYNTTITAPTDPTAIGYSFNGWNTAPTGGTKVTFPYTVTTNVTLYAQWTANIYTVTYHSGGGSVVANQTAANRTTVTAPADPTRTGYTFTGWFTAATGGTKVVFPYTVTSDLTFYAHWTANNYTITFNSNGGSAVASKTAAYDSLIIAPTAPTKTGYTLAAWYKDAAFASAWNFSSDLVSGNATLYAKWTANSYTVTFNSGGGSAVENKIADYNTAVTAPTDPTKTGYTFTGWFTAASSGTKITFPYTVTTNVTMYAQWTINSYTVSFNSNGGSSVSSKTAVYNTVITAPTAPTKTGYTFAGWYKDAAFDSAWNFASDVVSGSTTLYAKWTVVSYTVTFNTGGGSAVENKTADYNTTITAPADPTRTGYTFAGWYSSASSGTKVVFPYTVTANSTIYAVWTANNYTVTFKFENGTADYTVTGAFDSTIAAPADPIKTDFFFAGWFTEETGGTRVSNPYIVAGDATLYAHWMSKDAAGNVNGDGTIDLMDVTLLSRYVVGWNVTVIPETLDVTHDGNVDLKDVTLLSRYVAGWNVTL